MTVVRTNMDADALTLRFVAEFDAPVERIWQLWEDPRQLERWWGHPHGLQHSIGTSSRWAGARSTT